MKVAKFASLMVLGAVLAGCDTTNGPTPSDQILGVVALNSTGRTIKPYRIEGGISFAGPFVILQPTFDGEGLSLLGSLAITSESAGGGDRMVLVDLSDGASIVADFDEPLGGPIDPSKPFVETQLSGALVGGRATNTIYNLRLDTANPTAEVFARDAGDRVEKVVVAGGRVFAIDSNVDDTTLEPLGPSRVHVFDLQGNKLNEIVLPEGAVRATDAVVSDGQVVVLNSGTDLPGTGLEYDGSVVLINPATLDVTGPMDIGGNGLAIEDGRDGRVYVTAMTGALGDNLTLSLDAGTASFIFGPDNAIAARDAAGAAVSCQVATAVEDGRLLCATLGAGQESGEIFLLNPDGSFISSDEGGVGTTDLEIVVLELTPIGL